VTSHPADSDAERGYTVVELLGLAAIGAVVLGAFAIRRLLAGPRGVAWRRCLADVGSISIAGALAVDSAWWEAHRRLKPTMPIPEKAGE
jgi:hypothetical protein